MSEPAKELLTSGAIAKELGISANAVKKAIEALALAPVSKKGPCNYYDRAQLEQIKASL